MPHRHHPQPEQLCLALDDSRNRPPGRAIDTGNSGGAGGPAADGGGQDGGGFAE